MNNFDKWATANDQEVARRCRNRGIKRVEGREEKTFEILFLVLMWDKMARCWITLEFSRTFFMMGEKLKN